MSVNFDPVEPIVPSRNSLVQSSPSPVASSSSQSSSSPSPSTSSSSSSSSKLIAFPPNNCASSLSVNGSDYITKKPHQLNDERQYLDNCPVEHCTVSPTTSPSSSSSSSSVDLLAVGERKSLETDYSITENYIRLDREWCSARKRQLDEILSRLQQLHKDNLDDRENIEGMRKKTIKLIATYSSITTKTNNFLTHWDRKYGFKLKHMKTSSPSPSSSSSSSSPPFSHSIYDERFDSNYLFNSTPIW